MALIDDLAARLKETTDDLEAEIGSRYPGVGRHAYANEQRRFERDMASVRAARKLLADYEAAGGNTNGKMPTALPDCTATGGSHQFDALLCELGAFGVRLDVLRGK